MLIDHENGDRKIRLTEKETAILKYLFRAGEKVIGRDVLLNEVWGYNSGVTTHTLETHVYRLRQKIERDASNAELLVTEPGGADRPSSQVVAWLECGPRGDGS